MSTVSLNSNETVVEAQQLARRVIETEKGKCGGNVSLAIFHASSLYGVDENSLRVLWERRARKFVKAHVLLRLREIDEWLEAKASREREIIRETAEVLEKSGSPAAKLARKIAEMADAGES